MFSVNDMPLHLLGIPTYL